MNTFVVMVLFSFLHPANASNLQIDFRGAKLPQQYLDGQFEMLKELIVQEIETSCPDESLDLITRNDAYMATDLFQSTQFFSILNKSREVLFKAEVDWNDGAIGGVSYGASGLHNPKLYDFQVYNCQ